MIQRNCILSSPSLQILSGSAVRILRHVHGNCQRALFVSALALSLACAASAQKPIANANAVVTVPVLDMMDKASANSEVTSQVLYGTGVLTVEKQGEWTKIHTADEYTGWVRTSALRDLAVPFPTEGKLVKVTALVANLYREPDVTVHAPVLRLPWESLLESIPDAKGNNDRWLQVRLADGQTAWIQHGDITTNPIPVSIDEMLALAHRFLGITYTWGGTSSLGFDCSGFTQMLERQRGIEMPRDADIQAKWSGVVPVERKDMKPGDLLYFGSRPHKITHTGMYLGNGLFIHDTTFQHPGVQISSLSDEHWNQLLLDIRRTKN